MKVEIGKHLGKDMKFEMAPHSAIDALGEFPYEFLYKVFGINWALITDESSLWDFSGDRAWVFGMVAAHYGVDVSDIKSGNLVEVLHRIRPQN